MSYLVEVKRTIALHEVMQIIKRSNELEVHDQNPLVPTYGVGKEQEYIYFTGAEMQATSPSDGLVPVLERLAKDLNAELVGEEDNIPGGENGNDKLIKTRWLGWPILVIILLVTLIIRW